LIAATVPSISGPSGGSPAAAGAGSGSFGLVAIVFCRPDLGKIQ
jgi:hypothetical protein